MKFATKIQAKYFKNFKIGFGFRYWVLKKSDSGSGTGSGFENFPKNRVLGSGQRPATGPWSIFSTFRHLFHQYGINLTRFFFTYSLRILSSIDWHSNNFKICSGTRNPVNPARCRSLVRVQNRVRIRLHLCIKIWIKNHFSRFSTAHGIAMRKWIVRKYPDGLELLGNF